MALPAIGAQLLGAPKFQAFDGDGDPLSGGKLYSYVPGTTTSKSTYSDKALTTANANPVVLDSRGEATVYLSGPTKLVLKTSTDVTVWTMDNVEGSEQGAAQNLFYVDAAETDQGAAGNGRSVKDLVDAIGSNNGTLRFVHTGSSATTTYTFATAETIPGNIRLQVDEGALLYMNNVTLTLGGGPDQIMAGARQKVFTWATTTSPVAFSVPGTAHFEWWGVSTSATAANNRTYANVAIAAMINKGLLYVNGAYSISDELQITIASTHDGIHIEGRGWETGFTQTGTGGEDILVTTLTGAGNGWADVFLANFTLTGNASSGDGIVLRRAKGHLQSIQVTTIGGTAFDFLGCIEISGGNLWAQTCDIGYRLGTLYQASPAISNSTNASTLSFIRCNTATTAGLYFEADDDNSLEPKGNTITGFEYGGGNTAKIIHFKGGSGNVVDSPWCEGGAYGLYMEADGSSVPLYNVISNPRFVTNNLAAVNINEGADNKILYGYYSYGVYSVAFTSGSEEPAYEDTVVGATSEATAAVAYVSLSSGTWAGGDAAGTLYVRTVSGTFEAENLNISGGTENVMTIGEAPAAADGVIIGVSGGTSPDRNQFSYIRNFPYTAAAGLDDNGTSTLIVSYGSGTNDSASHYVSYPPAYANNTNLRWLDAGGTARAIVTLNSSDDVVIYDADAKAALRLVDSGEVRVVAKPFALTDGIAAPDTVAGLGLIYIDTADGDLKIKFGDGTVKTIVVDTE